MRPPVSIIQDEGHVGPPVSIIQDVGTHGTTGEYNTGCGNMWDHR